MFSTDAIWLCIDINIIDESWIFLHVHGFAPRLSKRLDIFRRAHTNSSILVAPCHANLQIVLVKLFSFISFVFSRSNFAFACLNLSKNSVPLPVEWNGSLWDWTVSVMGGDGWCTILLLFHNGENVDYSCSFSLLVACRHILTAEYLSRFR